VCAPSMPGCACAPQSPFFSSHVIRRPMRTLGSLREGPPVPERASAASPASAATPGGGRLHSETSAVGSRAVMRRSVCRIDRNAERVRRAVVEA
jgi:hypothetical protein